MLYLYLHYTLYWCLFLTLCQKQQLPEYSHTVQTVYMMCHESIFNDDRIMDHVRRVFHQTEHVNTCSLATLLGPHVLWWLLIYQLSLSADVCCCYQDPTDPTAMIYGLLWNHQLCYHDHEPVAEMRAIYNYVLGIPTLKSRLVLAILCFWRDAGSIVILCLLCLDGMSQML